MSALSMAGTARRNLSAIRPQLMRTIYVPPLRNSCSTHVHRLLEHGASTMQAPARQMLHKSFARLLGYRWVPFGFPCARNRSRAFARYSEAPSKPLASLVPNRDRSIVLNWDTPQSDSSTTRRLRVMHASRPGQGGNASVTHGALLSRYRLDGTRKEGPNAGV